MKWPELSEEEGEIDRLGGGARRRMGENLNQPELFTTELQRQKKKKKFNAKCILQDTRKIK